MNEITPSPRSTGSIFATVIAIIFTLFIIGIVLKLIGWALSALIPLLVVVALVLVIIRLYQGKKIL
jgi:CHASE2 domain-containing sensor protein